jgi:hypothetical protein
MPRSYHVFQSTQGGRPAPMLADDPNPTLVRRPKAGTVMIGVNIELGREIAVAIFEHVRIDVDHQWFNRVHAGFHHFALRRARTSAPAVDRHISPLSWLFHRMVDACQCRAR